MKAYFSFKNIINYSVKLIIDNNIFDVMEENLIVELEQGKHDLKIIIKNNNKSKFLNNISYNFAFHKNSSLGFFQYEKKYCFCFKEYSVLMHRDCKIDFDIVNQKLLNQFNINDKYTDIKIIYLNNIKILETDSCFVSKNDNLKSRIIDCILFFIKAFVIGVISFFVCNIMYVNRNDWDSIFQGDMIWVNILLIIIFYVIYIVNKCFKIKKAFQQQSILNPKNINSL